MDPSPVIPLSVMIVANYPTELLRGGGLSFLGDPFKVDVLPRGLLLGVSKEVSE